MLHEEHGCVVFMQDAPRMPERKEGRNKHSMPTKTLGKRPTTHAPNLPNWGLSPQSQCRMPPATDPDGPAALNPLLVALSRSNMFAHTRANGQERLIEHTFVSQKSCSSNPAFPCSALRIKASPSSPMKFVDSLCRDADRKVVHTGGILPQWPSARQHVSV